MALTLHSTVGQWLDHPVGGPIFTELITSKGGSVEALAPASGMPLDTLVKMSGGKFPQEAIEAMLAAYREAAPEEAAATDASKDASGWVEKITPHRFDGETVIVTGAASGIGRAVASRVAREGGRVIAVDLAEAKLIEFAEQLAGALHDDAAIVPVAADITNLDHIARIVETAGPNIAALANVAGIMDDMSALHEVSDQMWERVMRVNLYGMAYLTRAVLASMFEAKHGRIVNVASEAGLRGSAAGVAYTTSKHAVVGLTKSCAVMYAQSGIRVNAVAPGGVATGIQVPGAAALGAPLLAAYQRNIPSIAFAEELAACITFLLSKDSVNINGAIVASDGGWSAV